jgi:hypothetical protein
LHFSPKWYTSAEWLGLTCKNTKRFGIAGFRFLRDDVENNLQNLQGAQKGFRMGWRGPQRTPGSQRWNAEVKKKRAALASAGAVGEVADVDVRDLPKCPRELSRAIADRWLDLLLDMVAAGIAVKQIDSRCIAVAARYEDNLHRFDEMCERADLEPEVLLSALRSRQSGMKEYLAALEKIGGTPLVRMRAKIAPEEKPVKDANDPWGKL